MQRFATKDTKGRVEHMEINVMSILVDDQDKALEFYTTKLGFVKKHDVPVGDANG